MSEQNVLGNTATITFGNFHKEVEGKVDTGATTSSLHAENIKVDQQNNRVSFTCPELSSSVVTVELDGAQEVVSADAGGNTRPMVKFDVAINGIPIRGATFNLNDRSEMDSPILIGQNILKAGNFVVDVAKDDHSESPEEALSPREGDRDARVLEALQTLSDNNVTLSEIIEYIQTTAITNIK